MCQNQEHARAFPYLRYIFFPLCCCLGFNERIRKSDICCQAEFRGRGELLQQVLQEGIVPVGRFDEYLRLMQCGGVLLAAAYGCTPLVGLGGEVSAERETLPVETGTHQREHQRGRTDERHHGYAQAVAQGGSFKDCMDAVAMGVGQSISDLDAYKKAVQFYFPGAEIRMSMTVDLVGAADRRPDEIVRSCAGDGKKGIVLDLEDFL